MSAPHRVALGAAKEHRGDDAEARAERERRCAEPAVCGQVELHFGGGRHREDGARGDERREVVGGADVDEEPRDRPLRVPARLHPLHRVARRLCRHGARAGGGKEMPGSSITHAARDGRLPHRDRDDDAGEARTRCRGWWRRCGRGGLDAAEVETVSSRTRNQPIAT